MAAEVAEVFWAQSGGPPEADCLAKLLTGGLFLAFGIEVDKADAAGDG